MEKTGKQLKFLSQINRDGSGTHEVTKDYIALMSNDTFNLTCLSLSEKPFIANGFNSFVVRLKRDKRPLAKVNNKFKKIEFKEFTLNDMKKACDCGIDIVNAHDPEMGGINFQPFEDLINSIKNPKPDAIKK